MNSDNYLPSSPAGSGPRNGKPTHDRSGNEQQPKDSLSLSATSSPSFKSSSAKKHWWYTPLPLRLVEDEHSNIEVTRNTVNKLWEEECAKYGQTIEKEILVKKNKIKKRTLPRRNYVNADAIIQDETLFPYHVAFYPLLDAYDCLYEDEASEDPCGIGVYRFFENIPMEERQLAHQRDDVSGIIDQEEVPGYMPSTIQAVMESLIKEGFDWERDWFTNENALPVFYEEVVQLYFHNHLRTYMDIDLRYDKTRAACEAYNDQSFWAETVEHNIPEDVTGN